MNEVEWIKSLDGRDVREAPPVDVANAVMREIRARQSAQGDVGRDPLGIAALLATLAGGGAVAYALVIWTTLQDPFVNLFDSVKLVLQ
jgi:hypothetical protein